MQITRKTLTIKQPSDIVNSPGPAKGLNIAIPTKYELDHVAGIYDMAKVWCLSVRY